MISLTDGSTLWEHPLGAQVTGPSISPDGTRVALPVQSSGAPETSQLRILDASNGQTVATPAMPQVLNPASSAFSPDGAYLVVGGYGGELWLLETGGYTTVWLKPLKSQTRAVAWSPDSQTIYASTDPSPIYAINRGDGSIRWQSYTTSFAYQDNIAIAASGNRIAVTAKYGGFVILDGDGNEIFRESSRDGGGHVALAATDGSFFVSSAGSYNGAHILDPTGKLYWWTNHTYEGVAISPDRRLILLGAALYEIGGTLLWSDDAANAGGPHAAVMSPDSSHIVVAGENGKIFVFEWQVSTPAACTFALDPIGASVGSGAATGTVAITASASDCVWAAQSNVSWLTITGGAGGTGSGTISYSISANTTVADRTGTITAGGQTFTLGQDGIPCTYTRAAATTSFGSGRGIGAVQVTASHTSCAWVVSAAVSWIAVTGAVDRTGSADVVFSIAANAAGAARTGHVIVAGESIAITQAAHLLTGEHIAFGLTSVNPAQSMAGGWMATRGGSGGSFGATPWTRLPWSAYNAAGKGTHVAAGDVDGDGRDELVVGVESGGNGWMAILDDAANNYALLQWIQVPWSTYNTANGEVWPAVGDIDNDGRAEIVAGLGTGAGGWFAIFDDAAAAHALIGWRRVAWATYNAGDGRTYPAVGNVNVTAGAEIILGLGRGSSGWIEVFSSSASAYSHLAWIQVPWPTYNAANGETHVAAGDLDGDGRAEIVAGLGAGGGGWLHIFDDANASYASVAWRRISWAAYSADSARGHTFPAVGDVDGDAGAEIVLGLAPFPEVGGWFEILDDNGAANASLGWRNVGWPAFTSAGGGLYPAVGRFR